MTPRPQLPVKHINPHIQSMDSTSLPPVKYQLLDRDGQEVLVGRMKIPTPGGHAFILRRFDTGAISLTTMFRAAFPTASEQEEKRETNWVRDNYDLAGNNGSTKEPAIIRLAGVWVDPPSAETFANAYSLGSVISLIAKAEPDLKATYRRSSKAVGKSPSSGVSNSAKAPVSTPSPTAAPVNPAKRRRESSPVPFPTPPGISPPRRSARTKSPAPAPVPVTIAATIERSAKKASRKEPITPGGSEETIIAEDMEIADMAGPDMQQDVAEQKELIENLKAQREVTVVMDDSELAKQKRPREEEDVPLQFEFKEPEVGERAIATNSRIGRFHLEPRTKSFAWGVAAFAAGLSAIAFLPNPFL